MGRGSKLVLQYTVERKTSKRKNGVQKSKGDEFDPLFTQVEKKRCSAFAVGKVLKGGVRRMRSKVCFKKQKKKERMKKRSEDNFNFHTNTKSPGEFGQDWSNIREKLRQ